MARLAFLLPDMRGGGAERVALTLIEHFSRLGHSIDLLLMEASGELLPLLPPGIEIVDLGARRIRNVVKPLVSYLRRRRPDALQISMWPLTVVGILAHRIARSRARLVVSDHITLSAQYPDPPASLLLRASTRLFYPRADARIFVSGEAADDLASISGLARQSFDIIYNPIPPAPPPGPPEPEIEAAWGDAKARILSVGSLKGQKNHKLLIRAFAALPPALGARLMILGEGPLRGALERLAGELGVSDRLILPGFSQDPWPFYRSADLFVLSSDYEGFGNVLVEAMRCGLPIVSTDCKSGPREILADGAFGILVPVGDTPALTAGMEAALESDHDSERLKARAEQLSGNTSADRYLQLMLPGVAA